MTIRDIINRPLAFGCRQWLQNEDPNTEVKVMGPSPLPDPKCMVGLDPYDYIRIILFPKDGDPFWYDHKTGEKHVAFISKKGDRLLSPIEALKEVCEND